MTYSGQICEACNKELSVSEVANLGCTRCLERRIEASKKHEEPEHFNARVLHRTGQLLQDLPVRFVPNGGALNGQIVARRGHALVVDERPSEDSPPQYVLNFIGVNPMNVHYTSTPLGASCSGYTLDDAGCYPPCDCRHADCIVIPARVFELAMMFYDESWGFDHRTWDDAAAAYAADFYLKNEGDMIPDIECEYCMENPMG